ncbi:MAG: indole-3-glycerol phosphate synthase TrpC [Acidobacteriota bacterium]|nr:indole-3-glycerol phosphate synthase TrpC [Acidobacteriota bacterium]
MTQATGTILDEIIAARLRRIEQARGLAPLEALAAAAESRAEFRDFSGALAAGGLQIIAEMKKASPSAGLLRDEYDCVAIARSYAASGAAAISVLTEPDYFQGSLGNLRQAREAGGLPVLRKDFILDEYQVYESVASGADALLLIVAALPDRTLRDLAGLCSRLKIAALVEAHSADEIERAVEAGARIVGVNNRDLKTLQVNLAASLELRERIPPGCLAVAESGIRTADDLRALDGAGFHAALIGERFMRSADPGIALAELLAGARQGG